jgi:DnaK suppressor protein
MIRDELLRLRASAQAEEATLAQDLQALFSASRDSNADDEHDPEGATVGFERAQLTALLAATRDRIDEIDDALRRLDTQTYGLCETCGKPIGDERLVARPFARLCMACA